MAEENATIEEQDLNDEVGDILGEEEEQEEYILDDDVNGEMASDEDDDNEEMKKLAKQQQFEETGEFVDDEEAVEEQPVVDDSVANFILHTDSIYKVAAFAESKDSVLLATAGGDDTSYICRMQKKDDAVTIEPVFHLQGHTDTIQDVAFSADGAFVATGCMDATVGIWDVKTGKQVQKLEGPAGDINSIEWHPKGTYILAGTGEGTAWVWNAKSGKCQNVYAGHSEGITCVTFTADQKKILTGSADCTVRVWDPLNATTLHTFSGPLFSKDSPVACIKSRVQDASVFLCGLENGQAKLCNTESKKILATLSGHADAIECVDFAFVMPIMGTSSSDGKVCLWDANTMQLRQTIQHDDSAIKIVFDKKSHLLYSCSSDRSIGIWDIRTGANVKRLTGHKDIVLDFAFATLGDESYIVSCSDDCRLLAFKY